MRVIGGQYRSRRLVAPPGSATRPTSDRLRETLFNVLGPRVKGARFLDLYAGSGAVGIEALSRGTTFCSFVEQGMGAVKAIRANLAALGIVEGYSLSTRSVAATLRGLAETQEPFDLVFLDPPYEAAEEYAATLRLIADKCEIWLAPGAVVVAEHARRRLLEEAYGELRRTRLLEQGDAALSFYRVAESSVQPQEADSLRR